MTYKAIMLFVWLLGPNELEIKRMEAELFTSHEKCISYVMNKSQELVGDGVFYIEAKCLLVHDI